MTSQNHAGAGAPAPGAPASAASTNIPTQASPSPAASTTAATTASTPPAAATNIPAQASPSPAASTTTAGHTEAPLAQASPAQAEPPNQAGHPAQAEHPTQAEHTKAPLTQPSTTQAGRRRRRVVHLGPKDRERVAEGANLEQIVQEALGKVDAGRPAWSHEDLRREDPSAHANDARLLGDVPPHYGNGA